MMTRSSECTNNDFTSRQKPKEKQQPSPASNIVSVTGVHMSKSKLKLRVGQLHTLTASVLPANASNQTMKWMSSKPEIADIAQKDQTILVSGKQPGRAILVVTTEDGAFRDVCIVTVHACVTNPK